MTTQDRPSDDAAHLLIVDDDKRIRELLSRYLAGEGFRVTVAGDADEARRRLEGLDFDLIVMDAFTSDAIPIHLITREAIGLYVTKLRPAGVLVFNVSNRMLDVKEVLATIARDAGLTAITRYDGDRTEDGAKLTSEWVAMARSPEDLAVVRSADPGWRPLAAPKSARCCTSSCATHWATQLASRSEPPPWCSEANRDWATSRTRSRRWNGTWAAPHPTSRSHGHSSVRSESQVCSAASVAPSMRSAAVRTRPKRRRTTMLVWSAICAQRWLVRQLMPSNRT